MAGALDGITVLDLTQGMAGALATMFLCDNGATVIRVGSQESEAERRGPAYAVWDRGKQSVFLDISIAMAGHEAAGSLGADTLEASRELDRFHHLVRNSDVLIESFPPSSAVQALFDYQALASISPRLVHCSITAYGSEGPLRDQPAADDLVMARTGILSTQPSPRPGPIHVVHRLPSVGAGILAALGTVAALLAREKGGRGRKVETSLMGGALLFAPKIAGEKLTPRPTQRATVGGGPFYSAFECADRVWIHLGCVHSRFVDRAAVAMGITDVMADPKFGDGRNVPSEEARQELFDIVGGVIKSKPSEDWATLFEEADVPCARVRTVEEGMDDPQVRMNDMVIELRDPELGAMSQMGLPVKLSETPGKIRGPRPVPGQDTDTVLSALSERRPRAGYTADPESKALDPPLKGVKVLETANVIAGPTASRLLAELGAEVIKLEPPDGDISRPAAVPYFYHLNSNKRSVSANTRTPQGKEVARRLAARADVLLANLRPGATDRMGIGTEVLNELNPGIIQTHVTGFGWTGPYAHRPGLDPWLRR